jgi:hypothetical protein
MSRGDLGCIVTPRQGNRIPDRAVLAADNGVYGKGWPGEDAWWDWVRTLPADRCRFTVAPDVVADAQATLVRSMPFLGPLRAIGHRPALVAQNGQEDLEVPWSEIDTLFIGGDTDWKLGEHARALTTEAKRRGKWVHMGRVNSERRIRYAHAIGCDSADGTYIARGPDRNLPNVLAWLRGLDHETLPI